MKAFQDAPLDALTQYMHEVRAIIPLEPHETPLLLHAKKGDCSQWQQARSRLVEGYQPFVISVAKRYAPWCKRLTLLDLVQEGNIGLLEAVDRYDEKVSGAAFSAWAYHWVRGAMVKAICKFERFIRLPSLKLRELHQLSKFQADLAAQSGREATIDELVAAFNIPQDELLELLALQAQQVVSLDDLSRSEDDASVGAISDSMEPRESEALEYIRHLIESLPERERSVMKLRYGGSRVLTHREVADHLGISAAIVADIDRRVRVRLQRKLHKLGMGTSAVAA
jgi:RNA polymerase primary sigma factor